MNDESFIKSVPVRSSAFPDNCRDDISNPDKPSPCPARRPGVNVTHLYCLVASGQTQ